MDINAMHPGPRDLSLLHLQDKHRSKEIWRVGGGDPQKFESTILTMIQILPWTIT